MKYFIYAHAIVMTVDTGQRAALKKMRDEDPARFKTDQFMHDLPILFRWAFMNYALCSPQDDLVDQGEAVWSGGAFNLHGDADRPADGDDSLKTPFDWD